MPLRVKDWVGDRVYEFKDLDAYLASPFWMVTKRRYRESARLQDCFICGRPDTELHHVRYDRLGMELDDLVPLCPDHHYEIEKHLAKGLDGVTRRNAHIHYAEALAERRHRRVAT